MDTIICDLLAMRTTVTKAQEQMLRDLVNDIRQEHHLERIDDDSESMEDNNPLYSPSSSDTESDDDNESTVSSNEEGEVRYTVLYVGDYTIQYDTVGDKYMCNCKHFEHRIKNPVSKENGCKHIQDCP